MSVYLGSSCLAPSVFLLLLLLLSCFNRVRLCATPGTAAHQAPPSLGFSRQEHWSGLPFPSPMHESEKWNGSCSVMFDSATPWTAAHQAPPSMGFSRQEYWSGVPLPSPLKQNCYVLLRQSCITHVENGGRTVVLVIPIFIIHIRTSKPLFWLKHQNSSE